ncbi:hypothetical protein A2276_06615 [candidate division WOR-1 bacterium RIFOXYA12_FULL_43_27]|uniref:Uncharacterized protein n=1 Tax=candidate division WOR-1 bacterium RIFOXYC2_FULL_46_14 TaxID=1802587 RepID=A0A1F4U5B7_UNCSA|nr:MAG: hypothetical protein A2276_06615 [candidate division WOR-1 bacterium RIFOXYA12_FULL_43_27]OGC20319.1 MAG: hypothetical protein A2292_04615 [candidate division WOR-1 bacterium RIFOXYB2_FULL_46_45]OGC31944.1 MAG: hypothetical protein A2232_06835 [candidate division WOR-1 bacterium RIFOXYA2_FULL_46_56]OGC40165.1 MAG: hypothetical protein A2438_02635 [candidate division WOR-1 bacterium RIFOXYC2_FULL_46_14]
MGERLDAGVKDVSFPKSGGVYSSVQGKKSGKFAARAKKEDDFKNYHPAACRRNGAFGKNKGFLVGLLDKLPKPEYAKKAYAELNKGNYALAHDLLKTAVEQNRRSDVLDLLSAEIFRREGIPSQAAIIIEKKIEERKVCGIDPFVPYMRLQLGIIYKKGHLWEKSLDNFLRVQKECSGGSEYSLRALYYSSRIAVIISR